MDLSIQAKDNEFESETTSTRKKSPSRIESFIEEPQEEERMGFPLIIEEIFKLLLAESFQGSQFQILPLNLKYLNQALKRT